MTKDPILEHVIGTKPTRVDKLMAYIDKRKTSIVLGTALAASFVLNVLLTMRPTYVHGCDLTHDDIDYINRLLEEERIRNGEE